MRRDSSGPLPLQIDRHTPPGCEALLVRTDIDIDVTSALPSGATSEPLSPEFRLTGRATAGHILAWDYLAVMHRATESRYSDADRERRLLHRISTRSERELEPA